MVPLHMAPARSSLVLALVALAAFAACSDGPAPPPAASSTSNAPAATTSAAPPAEPVASSTPSATGPKKTPPKTGRPSVRKWCEAKTVHHLGQRGVINGLNSYACAYIEVEDWIMVACPRSGGRGERELGNYDRAVPGGGSMATPEEIEVGPIPEATDAVVISLRPGGKATPVFFYRPVDHPEWTREEKFTFAMAADAQTLADRSLPTSHEDEERSIDRCAALEPSKPAPAPGAGSAGPVASAAPEEPAEIADIAGHPAAPDDAAWDAEKETMVGGSDALGCKTKLKDGWFRAVCEGKVKFTEVVVEKGKHATQTVAKVEDGKATLVTPYVDGTFARARFVSDAGTRYLKLHWPGGKKRPYEVATFTEGAAKPE
jgi:hypothetical protein